MLAAFFIHSWHERHPSHIAVPGAEPRRLLQINFSSTDIAGNIGGLIFVVGSLVIVSIALPSVFWFLFAGSVAACFVAWGLVAWHWHTRGIQEQGTYAGRPPRQLL